MTKFQAKYKVPVDIDGTEEKANSKGLRVERPHGFTKGSHSHSMDLCQLVFELEALGAKVYVSRNTIQLFWTDYKNIDQIERVLREIIVTMDDSQVDIGRETRIEVPTIRGAEEKLVLMAELVELQKKVGKLEVQKAVLETLVEIEEKRIQKDPELWAKYNEAKKQKLKDHGDMEFSREAAEKEIVRAKKLLSSV